MAIKRIRTCILINILLSVLFPSIPGALYHGNLFYSFICLVYAICFFQFVWKDTKHVWIHFIYLIALSPLCIFCVCTAFNIGQMLTVYMMEIYWCSLSICFPLYMALPVFEALVGKSGYLIWLVFWIPLFIRCIFEIVNQMKKPAKTGE